jgi:hypothetical protein
MISVCINCGEFKPKHLARCNKCRFKPRRRSDIAKSIYLSQGLYTEDDRIDAGTIIPDELSEDELNVYAEKIKKEEFIVYDQKRMDIIMKQNSMLEATSTSEVLFNVLVKFLWPCWAIIIIAIILFIIKH